MLSSPEQQAVDAAITTRRSIRAFLSTPVAQDDIEAILALSGRAPSGTNTQPWKVYVVRDGIKERLSERILAAHADPAVASQYKQEYAYYPHVWTSPFIERRRKVGLDMYALLGLGREDKVGMAAQHGRNYQFFGAPVGFIFTMERVMEQGSWLDYGMFLQNIMLAARARGLDTCAQAAFTQYHQIIAEVLQLPTSETVVCGMALGFADHSDIVNTLRTEREPLSSFVTFLK